MQNEVSTGEIMTTLQQMATTLQTVQSGLHVVQSGLQVVQSDLQTVRSDLQVVQSDLREVKKIVISHDQRFDQVDTDIAEIHEAIQVFSDATDEQFRSVDEQFGSFNLRIMRLESQMVTKDYLDEKMGGLRGDMIQRMRTGLPKLAL